MKHLRFFENVSDYESEKGSLELPNVSYVKEGEVYYNPYVETMLVATYNVTSTTSETKLSDSSAGEYLLDNVEEMYVDGVKLDEPVTHYQFDSTGEHTVKYKLIDETRIPNKAFNHCYDLTSVTIPDSVTSIGDQAFNMCGALTSVTIGNGVTSIGGSAFYECTSLTSVIIPDSVTSIIEGAFYNCPIANTYVNVSDLAKYCLGNNIHLIPGAKHLLVDGKEITELEIPDSVTSIGDLAFHYCTSLTSITIPDSVTSIGFAAFDGCSSLTSVYCNPTTPPAFINNVGFMSTTLNNIYVPTESVEAYRTAPGWSNDADKIQPM